MIAVAIQYRPVSLIPWTRTIDVRMPSRWSEMNEEQVASVPELYSGKLPEKEAIRLFLGVSGVIAGKLDSYQRFSILRQLKYIKETEPLSYFAIKELAGFNAPGNKLAGITFGQFIFGDSYFSNYVAGKREDLDRFIACYYTGENGFNEDEIDAHARIISEERYSLREAIGINYMLIREWLAKAYPYCFEKATENTKKKKRDGGWVMVYDRLVENDFGNAEKYALKPVHEVLRYLNNKTKNFYKNGGKVQ